MKPILGDSRSSHQEARDAVCPVEMQSDYVYTFDTSSIVSMRCAVKTFRTLIIHANDQ